MDIPAPTQGKSTLLGFVLLIVLLIVAFLVAASLNLARTTTQTAQCPFEARQEAFRLAHEAEQQRTARPFRGNYGVGSVTICFKDGSNYYYTTEVYQGHDSATVSGYPKQKAHSEQLAYDEVYGTLAEASFDRSQFVGVYVVIFSQIIVCPGCQGEMGLWQRELRQEVHTNRVFLTIWQLRVGKGFRPKQFPGGTGTPVTINDIQQVFVTFDP